MNKRSRRKSVTASLDQIEEREDDDPQQIDHVPEAAAALDQHEVGRFGERPAREARERRQQPRSDDHMAEMEAGQREIETEEDIAVHRDPGGDQLIIFISLEQDE